MNFVINCRLPSRNEVDAANRSNKYVGAKMKKEVEDVIGLYIISARCKGTIRPTRERVIVDIKWHERTKKRDVDNIQSSVKFILDALQKQGIIPNDSQRYVAQIFHTIVPDSKDFVEVFLINHPNSDENSR